MELTLEQYERILHYLDGTMTPREGDEFLNELNQNSLLKENCAFEENLRGNLTTLFDKKDLFENEGSDHNGDFENVVSIRSLIERSRNEWKEENKIVLPNDTGETISVQDKSRRGTAKIITMKPWILAAAAACIIIAVISLRWFMPVVPVPPSVVHTRDTPAAGKERDNKSVLIVPRDSVKNVPSPKPKVYLAALFKKYYTKDISHRVMPDVLSMVPGNYQKGDYSFRDIDLGKQHTFRGPANDINSPQNILQLGHYYKGLSFIETNNKKEAIENLQWVIDSARSQPLKITARWYLALVYLKEGNTKKLIPLLSFLSTNAKAIPYNRQAQEILDVVRPHQE
ncbi:MAG: hypothetical protein ABI416_11835 [Ginsengibacter sp.]